MTLAEVLAFVRTATPAERTAIQAEMIGLPSTRQERAAVVLSQIRAGDEVEFTYDAVKYGAVVLRVNHTSATVRLTKIDGYPRRKMALGESIRVGASLLRKAA